MVSSWKSLELFLPESMSHDEVRAKLRTRVLCVACECGEFVHGIRIEGSESHTEDWRKWIASYRPGPPAAFHGSAP
jgi:hypothetical protein